MISLSSPGLVTPKVTRLPRERQPKGHTVDRTFWPHSGIHAPHELKIAKLEEFETGNGQLAFTADVVHPDRGLFGQAARDGRGDDIYFVPEDHQTFGYAAMDEFVAASDQDGRSLDPRDGGVTTLLEALLYETVVADKVAQAKRLGAILVRGRARTVTVDAVTSSRPTSSWRGIPVAHHEIALHRAHRMMLATMLDADPVVDRPLGGESVQWEMFTGQEWRPLLRAVGDHEADSDETFAAIRDASDAVGPGAPITSGGRRMHMVGHKVLNLVRERDGVLQRRRTPIFPLHDDTNPLALPWAWCNCELGPRSSRVRFEWWTFEEGCIASGYLHGAKKCRSLIVIE